MSDQPTVRDVLQKLITGSDCDLGVSAPSDGTCCADGCEEAATGSTVLGLRLCGAHFVQFYSGLDAGPQMKVGVYRIQCDDGPTETTPTFDG